jgi:hypothetical protein
VPNSHREKNRKAPSTDSFSVFEQLQFRMLGVLSLPEPYNVSMLMESVDKRPANPTFIPPPCVTQQSFLKRLPSDNPASWLTSTLTTPHSFLGVHLLSSFNSCWPEIERPLDVPRWHSQAKAKRKPVERIRQDKSQPSSTSR